MDSADSRPINRVTLACIQCRNRHVKCDATEPACNRCKRDGKECTYQKSRRGGLDKAALARRRLMLQKEAAEKERRYGVNTTQEVSLSAHRSTERRGLLAQGNPSIDLDSIDRVDLHSEFLRDMTFQLSEERLLESYYEHFYPPFPFTLPLHYLNLRKGNQAHDLTDLLSVMKWIGSLYAPWTPSEPYYEAAHRALNSPTLPQTPWSVQALILFAVAQHHCDIRPESRTTADMAIRLALDLQMNVKDFAQAYGEADPVLEESWRRTYYFLVIVDQHLAVVVNNPAFTLRDVPNHVDLPCDDQYYETGHIPPPTTWEEYNAREFADVEIVYSSIVYLYDMAKVVAYIMRSFTETGTFGDALIATVDAKVAIWKSLLPACKRDPMRPDGKVDEVMFMAHTIAAIVIMTSHRPFSSLSYSIEEMSTTSFVTPVPFVEPLKQARGTHTARALKAVDIQTRLLAIPCAVERHNVFTMCVAAALATAQISACNILLDDHALSIARDRVRLSIGFLNAMGAVWPLGKKMAKEVRYVARRTLAGLPSCLTADADRAGEAEVIPRDEAIWPVDISPQVDIYSGITLPWDQSMLNYSSSSTSSIS